MDIVIYWFLIVKKYDLVIIYMNGDKNNAVVMMSHLPFKIQYTKTTQDFYNAFQSMA